MTNDGTSKFLFSESRHFKRTTMFPKRITHLLRFFDAWGYCTESYDTSKYDQVALLIFLFHISLATTLTLFVFGFFLGRDVMASHYEMHQIVNKLLHFSSVLLTYFAIIIESYSQRKIQKHFWRIVRQIDDRFHRHKRFVLHTYLFKFTEFLLVFSVIQVEIGGYFAETMGFYRVVYYLLAYIVVMKMYQFRIFYYIFYVELINFELKSIETEVKMIYNLSRSNCPCLTGNAKYPVENFKWIRKYYCLVHSLNTCLNSIFGWSQLSTITCCFHLIVTDLNWAYENISTKSTGYIESRSYI